MNVHRSRPGTGQGRTRFGAAIALWLEGMAGSVIDNVRVPPYGVLGHVMLRTRVVVELTGIVSGTLAAPTENPGVPDTTVEIVHDDVPPPAVAFPIIAKSSSTTSLTLAVNPDEVAPPSPHTSSDEVMSIPLTRIAGEGESVTRPTAAMINTAATNPTSIQSQTRRFGEGGPGVGYPYPG